MRQYLKWGVLFLLLGGLLWLGLQYMQWQRDRKEAAVVARAVKYAVEQISPAYIDFVREHRKAPIDNRDLDLPPPRDSLWFGFKRVEVYPNGDVHFEFDAHEPSKRPLLVWHIEERDNVLAGSRVCGSRDISPNVLAWNGLRCDTDVATPEKDAPIPMLAVLPARIVTPADEVLDAVRKNSPEELSRLRESGYDLCAPNPENLTPLAEAVRGSQFKSIPALIEARCDINQIEVFSGRTALMLAAVARDVETVRALLAADADPNITTVEGDSAWFLLGTGSDEASQRVRQMLMIKGANINSLAGDQSTLLMRAAAAGSQQLANWLLANGAGVDLQDKAGRTALMYATLATRDTSVLQHLINRRAQINLKDAEGKTALALALSISDTARQAEVVRMLQAAGGKV